MKFRHLPVVSAVDSTQNFEQLQGILTALEPGVWTALTLGPKAEEAAAPQTVRARTEQAKANVRLRGAPIIKAGEKLKPAETLATLPEGFRPLKSVRLGCTANAGGVITANELTIATTGVMTLQVELNAGAFVMLDGLTFNLT